MKQAVAVVVGIVFDSKKRILVAKRPAHVPLGGLWEFPGGKLEPGEHAGAALQRELLEEVDIIVDTASPLLTVTHEYAHAMVELQTFHVSRWRGAPCGKEGQQIAWVARDDLATLTFPPSNQSIIQAVMGIE